MKRLLLFGVFAATIAPTEALAELDLQIGGKIQTDVRFRIEEKALGDFYDRRVLPVGLDRNENILKLTIDAAADRFRGFADVDFVWLGQPSNMETLGELSDRSEVEPVHFEAHAVYLEAADIFFDGLDLRLGQQIVSWGVGDQFNPTNNLNADDLEDKLLFGAQQANLMAKVDFAYEDYFSIGAVLVPIFKPTLLPVSGELAVAAVQRLPMIDSQVRHRIHAEQALAAGKLDPMDEKFPTIVGNAKPVMPEISVDNMQFGARFATTLAEQDIALSYYRGFSDFPVPVQNFTRQDVGQRCDPNDPNNCVDGLLITDTTLTYPKIQVAGLNIAGELPVIGLGYRVEAGLYFPEEMRITLLQDALRLGGLDVAAGEYAYYDGEKPVVLASTPYVKWVVGLDYTIGTDLYLNLQWVHGLADEVGAGDFITEGFSVRDASVTPGFAEDAERCVGRAQLDGKTEDVLALCEKGAVEILRNRLGDYIVLGVDFTFLDKSGLFRLFAILEVTGYIEERFDKSSGQRVQTQLSPFSEEGYSVVIFPELSYNFGHGFELAMGALIQLGKDYTKFGDPAGGGSLVWTRGRFSF